VKKLFYTFSLLVISLNFSCNIQKFYIDKNHIDAFTFAQPSSQDAIIYVLVSENFELNILNDSIQFKLNGIQWGQITAESFLFKRVSPDKYFIQIDSSPPISLNTDSGKIYYIQFDGHTSYNILSEAEGSRKISSRQFCGNYPDPKYNIEIWDHYILRDLENLIENGNLNLAEEIVNAFLSQSKNYKKIKHTKKKIYQRRKKSSELLDRAVNEIIPFRSDKNNYSIPVLHNKKQLIKIQELLLDALNYDNSVLLRDESKTYYKNLSLFEDLYTLFEPIQMPYPKGWIDNSSKIESAKKLILIEKFIEKENWCLINIETEINSIGVILSIYLERAIRLYDDWDSKFFDVALSESQLNQLLTSGLKYIISGDITELKTDNNEIILSVTYYRLKSYFDGERIQRTQPLIDTLSVKTDLKGNIDNDLINRLLMMSAEKIVEAIIPEALEDAYTASIE